MDVDYTMLADLLKGNLRTLYCAERCAVWKSNLLEWWVERRRRNEGLRWRGVVGWGLNSETVPRVSLIICVLFGCYRAVIQQLTCVAAVTWLCGSCYLAMCQLFPGCVAVVIWLCDGFLPGCVSAVIWLCGNCYLTVWRLFIWLCVSFLSDSLVRLFI